MKTQSSYTLGKCDYNGSGSKNCRAAITWTLEEGRFSMSAEIWNPSETDTYCGGQCVDSVAALFPGDTKAARMVQIWRKWHLNDMRAGTPEQMAIAKGLGYDDACAALKAAGKYIVEHNGKPYTYGSQWLAEELPDEVVKEIESWSAK